MRNVLYTLFLAVVSAASLSAAGAAANSLEISVSYRERIALPPDAELDVQLIGGSGADTIGQRIASQRFAMTGVPMRVALTYDPQVVDAGADYAVTAAIWSDGRQIFRTASRHDAFGETPVEIVLVSVDDANGADALTRSIAGVQWAVTEVAGAAWSNDDPATLLVDDQMNFSVFGGCNRFRGQLVFSDGEITVPENFAGTLMACPDEVEALERSFLDALVQASRYVRYGAGLVMTDASGNALLHFVEQPE